EAGGILLDAERAVRTATASAVQDLNALVEGRAGRVRLGAFASAAAGVVPTALANFRITHPNVRVTLSQLETAASYARILRGELDLAVTFDYDRLPAAPPPGIRRTLATKDPVLVALPAAHPLAGREDLSLSDLADEAWIGTPVTGLQLGLLAELSLAAGFQPRLQFDGDDFQTILGLVDRGLGVALLPELAMLLAPTSVVARPIRENPLTRFVYTARLDTRHTAIALAIFERCLIETLQTVIADR
ncbi:MAG: LysR substrate-binding domain-containing protein, partial [Jiangellaceae bacterium]